MISTDDPRIVRESGDQYLRKYRLVVFGEGVDSNGLDLSLLRIKFQVKRASSMSPNMADIRIFNMNPETASRIGVGTHAGKFNKILLEAGYDGNYGVIFQGNVMQVLQGRESATDTFVDLVAADGDRAYNFAVVNQTLMSGSTQADQVSTAVAAMTPKGVTSGHMGDFPPEKLPRAKVMYGPAKKYLRTVAKTTNKSWSVQDGKVTYVGNRTYLPGEVIKLTSATGMIGTPQQTTEGVNVKCLINPFIKVGGRVQIDNKSIQHFKINFAVPGSVANTPAALTADGTYYAYVVEHSGDTRGLDWYTSIVGIALNITGNPANAIATSNGG